LKRSAAIALLLVGMLNSAPRGRGPVKQMCGPNAAGQGEFPRRAGAAPLKPPAEHRQRLPSRENSAPAPGAAREASVGKFHAENAPEFRARAGAAPLKLS